MPTKIDLYKREILLGLTAVIALFLFIWGINYLKGKNIFQQQKRFYVVYPHVEGLIESHPVTVNGVKIGQVNRIFFHPDRSGRVVVECIVANTIDIPANSVAMITPTSLLVGFEVVLHLGDQNVHIAHGDTLAGEIKPGIEQQLTTHLLPIKDRAESLMLSLDTMLTSLNMMFGQDLNEHIQTGFSRLNNSLQHIETMAETLSNNDEVFNQIIQNLLNVTDTLAAIEVQKTLDQANESLATFGQVLQSVNEGEGSISLLLHDDALYLNLESSAKQLDMLLEDIRNNPRKYFSISLFGR